MSTFKFNFSGDDNSTDSPATVNDQVYWLECSEVKPKEEHKDLAVHAKMFTCGDVEIGHVIPKDALKNLEDNDLNNAVELADKAHSDLVAGKYEGGLKIWECTYDLMEYLIENPDKIEFQKRKVLDLGCGAGILGIFALLNGSHVTFQDYNKEVLECVTIPNVQLNIEDVNHEHEADIKNCRFYSGDWVSFNQKLEDSELYDLIVTSETIYNPDNYDKIIQLFAQRLAKDGVAYVAAKTHYFGVGGGMREFEYQIDSSGLLKHSICWKSSGGIQREILKVTRYPLLIMD